MALSKQWLDHIEAWQSSGLTPPAYCRQQGLNTHTFTARLSEYRKREQSSPTADLDPGAGSKPDAAG